MNEHSISCKMISQHFKINHILAQPDFFFLFKRGKEPESGFALPAIAHSYVPRSAFTWAASGTASYRYAGQNEVEKTSTSLEARWPKGLVWPLIQRC